MLLEERKPALDEKTIVKLIYVFKNDLNTRSVSSNFHTEFEINPLESDFYRPTPLPSGISWASDLPIPSKFPIPSMVGVWIFSGTTRYILKIVNAELFTQLARFELHKDFVFNCFWACSFVKLVNSMTKFQQKQLKVVG